MRKSPFREMDKMLLSSRDVGRVLFYKITDLVQNADYKPVDYRTCASSRACPAHACVQASTRTHACTKNLCVHAHARPHTHDRTRSLACAGYRHAHAIWTYAHRRTGRKERALRLSWPLQEGREAGKDRTGLRERRRRIGRHGTPKFSVPLLPYCHSQSKGYCDSLLPPSLRSLSRSPDGPKVTDAFSTFSRHRPDCADRPPCARGCRRYRRSFLCGAGRLRSAPERVWVGGYQYYSPTKHPAQQPVEGLAHFVGAVRRSAAVRPRTSK